MLCALRSPSALAASAARGGGRAFAARGFSTLHARPTALAPRACRSGAAAPPRSQLLPKARQRPLSTVVAEEGAATAESQRSSSLIGWLMKEGQVDSGFWQGTGLLAVVIGGVAMSSDQQKHDLVASVLGAYRTCGLKAEFISDRTLIEEYVRKNTLAAVNVLMASPVFYFMFARIYGESLPVCLMRSVTGSMRIVPFMGFFYSFFAIVCPFATQALMERGQTYEEAASNAAIGVMLSGFVFVEALVELRGCGVTFSQMTASSFLLFIPALVGRLATGVLTQQQKVGAEASEPLLPASWAEGPTWQAHTYMLFDRLALDKEFVVTCAGTSVFQHVLNSITWVLLTRGKASSLLDITKFMLGGPNGTVVSGLSQFGKTFVMRLGFSWAWNWCTSQQLELPVFDPFLKDAK